MHSSDFYQFATTPPATQLLSLTEIREWLKIDGVDQVENSLLQAMSFGVQKFFEGYTNRPIFNTQYKLLQNRLHRHIELRKGGVISVDSVTYIDQNQVVQTVDPSQYYLLQEAGYQILDFVYLFPFPAQYGRQQAATILFTAGMGTTPDVIPQEIKMGMKAHLLNWHENRGDADDAAAALPTVTKILYDKFKVISLTGGTYR